MLRLTGRSQQGEPCRKYEPAVDPRRTYLEKKGRVYSPEPGTQLQTGWGTYTVKPACSDEVSGLWVCVSHATNMPTTPLKDYHCFHPDALGGGAKAAHLLVWNCYIRGVDGVQHGPERAGPPGWLGEDRSPRMPSYPEQATERMR